MEPEVIKTDFYLRRWHMNIRLPSDGRRPDVEALDAAYGVTPTSPRRVWL